MKDDKVSKLQIVWELLLQEPNKQITLLTCLSSCSELLLSSRLGPFNPISGYSLLSLEASLVPGL